MRIETVRLTTCRVPLTSPIVMGPLRFDAREYVLVELVVDSGIVGLGFGMTRDAPLAAILARTIAPRLIGADPLLGEAIWERLYDANLTIGQRGLFMRCLSAVDIALWDIKAQAAGLPLWQLLGGASELVRATVAGGYPRSGIGLDELAAEMRDYVAAGYHVIKIAAGDLASDTKRLEVARAVVGPDRLAYDAHWAWRRVSDVLPVVERWRRLELAFIEDPFPSDSPRLAGRLRERAGIALALGEDLAGRYAFRDLFAEAFPDWVRLDATVAGGISEAAKVCSLAAIHSVPVLPHIFPELHVHLAAAFSSVYGVEVTDPRREVDLFWRLIRSPVAVRDGWIPAPHGPGLGIELDAAAVACFATDSVSIS